jgi:Membrane bound O-acyl transferase family
MSPNCFFLLGGASGLGLLFSLATGFAMEDFSDSPLTKSTSPSDFWGHRWDKPVESALKRGCFRPLRKSGYSRNVAALLTFFVSGFIHEYVLYFMSLRRYRTSVNSYDYSTSPTRGRQCLFFLSNGLLMVLERLLESQDDSFLLMKRGINCLSKLPQPLKTLLVLLLVLPISHWFTDEYIQSSFFADATFAFPILRFELLAFDGK